MTNQLLSNAMPILLTTTMDSSTLILQYGLPTAGVIVLVAFVKKWVEGDRDDLKKNKLSLESKAERTDLFLFEELKANQRKVESALQQINELQNARLTDKEEHMEEYFQLMNRFMDLLANNHRIMESSQVILKDLHIIISNSNKIIETYLNTK